MFASVLRIVTTFLGIAFLAFQLLGTAAAQPPGGPGADYEEQMRQQMEEQEMEMGYDPYEEEMNGGYGGGYGGGGGNAKSDVTQTYLADLVSLTDGFKLSPLFAPETAVEVVTGPVLSREADQAFAAGNSAIAIELMCGHMATEYDEASAVIRSAKFSMSLRRPVWALRWGASIAIRGSEEVTDPSPIREGATPPGRRMAAGGGGYDDSMSGYPDEEMQGMDDSMRMEQEMQDAMQSGMGMDGEYGMDGPGGPMVRPKPPVQKVREMLDAGTEKVMDENLGLVATMVAEDFASRFSSGDFGALFTGVAPPPPVDPRAGGQPVVPVGAAPPVRSSMMSPELDETLSITPEPLPMWKPGLNFVGSGPSNDMLADAKRNGIDFLLHFDVLLKPGRTGKTQNVSRCRLFNVATGKQLALTKGIDSLEASQLVASGRMADERAYVTEQMGTLFALIERETKLVPMPTALTAAAARGRVAVLIGGAKAKTLQTLAEIRLYQSLGLLTEPEVEMAFDIVGGADALLFLHGPRDERLAMAHTWAIEAQTPSAK
ncbi:hypothetical protein [Rubripirellula reticaptiva]|uniref:Uncharacterized protein n=1 Tax=Rubripirellula reticaptiva TaxID=2528013 RepID=A0A5C6ELJ6_9BACT|nr:hypothetical protein [Rubripirellula reticaptiva]TWU48461.1 hypothetical protein Poly59_53090 [Rubripirellula reticaptiva]